jgi:hypothetical protein
MKTKFKITALLAITLLGITSCVSIKSTLKNVDDNAPDLILRNNNTFVLTQTSTDKNYGYHKDYPVNIFYINAKDPAMNPPRFFNALTGLNGEKISYKKISRCCPNPTKRHETGAGLLDIYEVTWEGLTTPKTLYINIYEKGIVMAPMGFGLKK